MIPFHLLSFIKQTLEEKDAKSVSHLCAERGWDLSEDQIVMVPYRYSDLQVLQTRIKAIEKAMVEMEIRKT